MADWIKVATLEECPPGSLLPVMVGPDPVVLADCESLVVRPQPGFLDGWDQEVPYWRVYSDEELGEYGVWSPGGRGSERPASGTS